jgi:type IV pilus biogenesis protein CpaD/CtpE
MLRLIFAALLLALLSGCATERSATVTVEHQVGYRQPTIRAEFRISQ